MAGMKQEGNFLIGSGNVFADLDLPNSGELMAKAQMIHAIDLAMESKGISDVALATLVGVDEEAVARLLRGPRDEFPLERLAGILNALDRDVTITIRERPKSDERAARILVEAA